VRGPLYRMTFPQKEPSATISTNGVAVGFGNRFMIISAVRSGWPPEKNQNPVPAVSTAKPSRRLEPAGNGVTTRGKKIKGVKRHILVDTLGLLLAVVVHPANIQDRDGAKLVFAKAKLLGSWPRLERVWADGGYAGKLIAWVCSLCGWVLEIVKRNDDVKGFKLLPKRWVVERTFSWLSNYRRLSKHYEYWNETGEAMIQVAMIHLMLRRLTKRTSGIVTT
jgi:putative transposase